MAIRIIKQKKNVFYVPRLNFAAQAWLAVEFFHSANIDLDLNFYVKLLLKILFGLLQKTMVELPIPKQGRMPTSGDTELHFQLSDRGLGLHK